MFDCKQIEAKSIYIIVPDKQKRYWLGTDMGLYSLNYRNGRFVRFNRWEGALNQDYSMDAYAIDADGTILMGGDLGLTIIDSKRIKVNSTLPPIAFTAFTKFSKNESEKNLFYIPDTVRLNYNDSFSIEFSALNFTNPANNQYAYRIDDMHDAWIYLQNNRKLVFNNLQPGTPLLRVKGSNNDGVWNEAGTQLEIVILPPFWQTTLFRFIIIFIIISLVVWWYKNRIRMLAQKVKDEIALEQFYDKFKISAGEREIIALIMKGMDNKQIEGKLFISHGTVRNNVSRIYKKLNVKNRFELITLFKNIKG